MLWLASARKGGHHNQWFKPNLICKTQLANEHPRYRARICERLRSPGIDFKESTLLAYIASRAGTSNKVVVPACQAGNQFLGSFKDLQIRALFNAASARPGGQEEDRLFLFSSTLYRIWLWLWIPPQEAHGGGSDGGHHKRSVDQPEQDTNCTLMDELKASLWFLAITFLLEIYTIEVLSAINIGQRNCWVVQACKMNFDI